jgi:succinate-semialdehyde dehydrogenase/glutarate-semialdehyde dehydrogenase
MYINGVWKEGTGTLTRVVSPVDGTVLGEIHEAGPDLVEEACEAAYEASKKWRYTHHTERAKLLNRTSEILREMVEEIAQHITQEQGKPIDSSRYEAGLAVEAFRDVVEDMARLESSVLPSMDPDKRVLTIWQPLGVVGIITPWNFPFGIPVHNVAPVLAAGNTLVLKPASETPLIAGYMFEALDKAGFPPGVVNLVHGHGSPTGEALTGNELVDAVAFTGSTETGRRIAESAAHTIKTMRLELGGNGPIVVLDDADIALAAKDVAGSCYGNAGQVCTAGERIIVHERIRDKFASAVVEETKKVKLGNPFEEGITYGPLIDENLAQKVDRHIADARDKGATIMFGGRRAPGFPTNLYYEPTVLDGVTVGMALNLEETFGPVVPIIPAASADEALNIAETSHYGLSAGVYTRDISKAFFFAEHIQAGTVEINSPPTYWHPFYPTGGMKKSGIGREGGKFAITTMSQLKTVILNIR